MQVDGDPEDFDPGYGVFYSKLYKTQEPEEGSRVSANGSQVKTLVKL